MARYKEYKLGRFSTGISIFSTDRKIGFTIGAFSIRLVSNFVYGITGGPRPSYDREVQKKKHGRSKSLKKKDKGGDTCEDKSKKKRTIKRPGKFIQKELD